jgi:hypothetical protein
MADIESGFALSHGGLKSMSAEGAKVPFRHQATRAALFRGEF